ncbi:MAG: histidinol dehydrogenase, partial [Mesorhizobium sp.]
RDAVSDTAPVEKTVKEIIANVRTRGDAAVRDYSLAFDKADVTNFEITEEEKQKAVADLDPQTREDTEFAIANVRRFAEAQLKTILPLEIESLPGLHLGHRVIPIEIVGCYVPGGRYSLLSAPIMTLVPAKVAGCDQVIACLPPNAHPAMIAGCHLAGADRIFRVGGAQAIAAMAYGTETIPAVDKIVGPGNAFVNEAKRQVFGQVG